jgi:hypothetical protein
MNFITQEMRERAEQFKTEWRGAKDERAEAQTFTNEFFNIFGLVRRDYAQFEKPIQKKNEAGTSFADLFWTGKLIIESKSANKDSNKHWEKTLEQAKEYVEDLFVYQRPQFILLMNFKRFQIHKVNLKGDKVKIEFLSEIKIEDLPDRLEEFSFFPDFAYRLEEDGLILNQQAATRMANLYEAIEHKGYNRNDISVLLARILFCLFAEDTGIFEKKTFENYINDNTKADNLGEHLMKIFKTLDTPENKRNNLSVPLSKFPYVNGGLFDGRLSRIPPTTTATRDALLKCCAYDWSDISPVIFGSLFQAVIHEEDRRSLGAHFTSEKNILRLIRPLFLDNLRAKFEKIKDDKNSLEKFRKQINSLTFLDPACGCGNFLVITYRELRLLDMEIIFKQFKGKFATNVAFLSNIHLNNFHGIEIDQTSSTIAEVAMWLTEHQMNMRLESEFGKTLPTIPLDESAVITNGDALKIDWKSAESGKPFDYILGNPPFIGSKLMKQNQRNDIIKLFGNFPGAGVLDYVTGWYIKAAKTIQETKTKVAFVSTNSIVQGEQTSILWGQILNKYNVKIHFAHRTFKWSNEAKGNAAVYCVIVGFANFDDTHKIIYEYSDIKGEPIEIEAKNVNPYLVDAKDILIDKQSNPICSVPKMSFGNMPLDGGNLLFSNEEKIEFLLKEPTAKKYIKPLISAQEFLNGNKRWCLWLVNAEPNELKQMREVLKRIELVKKFRLASVAPSTQKFAATPALFRDRNQPNSFIVIPRVSSENRKYIPMGFFDKNSIVSDTCMSIPNGKLYHFGVLMSAMHMAWVKTVCGRLKSDYRYSKDIVYNNYPWPENISEKQIKVIEDTAQKVLDARNQFPKSSLSDLYDPRTMPAALLKAHNDLDKAVDTAYRPQSFNSDAKRLEYLFKLYEKYTDNLFSKLEKEEKKVKGKKRN